MMNKKEFIVVLIFTFISAMIWIVADIYHTKSSIPDDPRITTLLEPVNSTFDQDSLNLVRSHNPLIQVETIPLPPPQPTPQITPSPSVIALPSIISSESAILAPSDSTNSAQLP